MSRIQDVIRRYENCRAVLRNGVEIIAVGDPIGAALNSAVRTALFRIDEENKEVWGGLIRAANAIRWRRLTQPQPNGFNPAVYEGVEEVRREVKRLRGSVNDEALLNQISSAAEAVTESDSPLGDEILRLVREVGPESCTVVARNGFARAGLRNWLENYGVSVLLTGELESLSQRIEQSYILGPPTLFSASLVTAPATGAITFVMPAWFVNRSLPPSGLVSHAEHSSEIQSKVHFVGNIEDPPTEVPEDAQIVDEYYPQPVWGRREGEDREPESGEVEARKILLAGGFGLWLDDGERIRALDPLLPEGNRVSYEAVADVRPGTYLVLREGATEHGAMFEAAMAEVGTHAEGILATQALWKQALAERLDRKGTKQVIAELDARKVRAATRVRAWTDPTLICPRYEQDLALLLDWLGIPANPSFNNAMILRRAVYRASADLRQELEDAVGRADLRALEEEGFMHLELEREGFRGMIVARVLARAPFTEIVPRPQARVPFKDGGAQWLE
ncbi:MAG: hypothetical protein K1X67_26890 [Fimbriimonadaceae bacterium]|nr:hypothetical protein [Fimbriimonadaceae bacterium]